MSTVTEKEPADLWMQHMRNGELEEVWKLSDRAVEERAGKPCWHWPRHLQYIWDGTPLAGKRVLVRCYHGLGDTIQFIRYIPLLKEIAGEVIVWAQAPLLPLLKTVPGIDQLLPLHDSSPDAEYDVDVEIMELPHVFRTTLETLPAQVPYLHADPISLSGNSGNLKVGLVWRAGDWDARRSVPFDELIPLFGIEKTDIYILQAGAESAGWKPGYGIHPGEFDVNTYAGVIKNLDLMISVDSMPVHLAGALGVPVWNLLHADADWRWMKHPNESVWYPTMRLFRQEKAGEWKSVIDRVAAELEERSSSH
ncbi:glycosyltransferase family 9 protein [Dyadobacter flavalbus]|uniref:Glycosyltransferase family 9 protein n=1 Tax=Dyadobacter flavalbus TaxID=2579942 RepID=A0A5M8QSG4_9BACT|nr:glycosyltransferase family 9 protein [Dyadobacter flavalbus]KAA6439029.1 glycosyltransferase family 9 protein [Dyadobacter flavalbus]